MKAKSKRFQANKNQQIYIKSILKDFKKKEYDPKMKELRCKKQLSAKEVMNVWINQNKY